MRLTIALLAVAALIGCGKKPDSTSTPAPFSGTAKQQGVSIDASDAPPPPPVTATLTDPAPAGGEPPPPANPVPPPESMTPEAAEQYYKDGARSEKAYEERLKRNGKWLQALQKASPSEQQRILAEIRAAKLSPAEIQELEGIKQYFGVTVSFRQ
jgi:hypothetical protein